MLMMQLQRAALPLAASGCVSLWVKLRCEQDCGAWPCELQPVLVWAEANVGAGLAAAVRCCLEALAGR